MRFPIGIPLLVRNVKIVGPQGFARVDLILDTGAAVTALSWSVLKLIGYDPAVAPERHEAITKLAYDNRIAVLTDQIEDLKTVLERERGGGRPPESQSPGRIEQQPSFIVEFISSDLRMGSL